MRPSSLFSSALLVLSCLACGGGDVDYTDPGSPSYGAPSGDPGGIGSGGSAPSWTPPSGGGSAVQGTCEKFLSCNCGTTSVDDCVAQAAAGTWLPDSVWQCITALDCATICQSNGVPECVDPYTRSQAPVGGGGSVGGGGGCRAIACSEGSAGDALCRSNGCGGGCFFGGCNSF